ncbi:MAG: histone deacetylase, partial [Planctomycetaceae bacterium]
MDATSRRTGLVVSTAFAEHLTGPGHPERPDRTTAIVERLEADGLLARARMIEPRHATDDDILRCHTPAYLEVVKKDVAGGAQRLSTGDTPLSARSLETARLAAGGVLAAVDAVMDG